MHLLKYDTPQVRYIPVSVSLGFAASSGWTDSGSSDVSGDNNDMGEL